MNAPESKLTPQFRRALLNAIVRQNDVGFVRGREIGVCDTDLDAMEAAGWLKRMNDAPHERRPYRLTDKGAEAIMPSDLRTILRSEEEIASDANLTFRPDPDDSTLVIGSNGHRYPETRLPTKRGWPYNAAWEVLDCLQPEAIPVNVRLILSGLIASVLQDAENKIRSQYATRQ